MKKRKNRTAHPRSKLRFFIYNDTSHEEVFSFRSSRGMALLGLLLSIILIIGLVTVLISFTPLKQLIPGYPSPQMRITMVDNAIKIDSLERIVRTWEFQLDNIHRVISGLEPISLEDISSLAQSDSTLISNLGGQLSREDSLLRATVIQQEQFNIRESTRTIEHLEGLHMFTPVKGVVSNGYNPAANHPYIDIAAPANSVVSSILDGTVTIASYVQETGYTIHIQHENNLISVYKHNAKLLKETGDRVSAGTAIALVGNSGSLSYGNHLHFELWHKGVAIDPEKYIKF